MWMFVFGHGSNVSTPHAAVIGLEDASVTSAGLKNEHGAYSGSRISSVRERRRSLGAT
jgi:hypothetical protein